MSDVNTNESGPRTLSFQATDPECLALSVHYAGIKFNLLRLVFLPALALHDDPEREEMKLLFNVSGSARDLTRHGFGHESWWPLIPASGITNRCVTEGFGHAWRTVRSRAGYRLQGAQYADGLTKAAAALCPVFMPAMAPARKSMRRR